MNLPALQLPPLRLPPLELPPLELIVWGAGYSGRAAAAAATRTGATVTIVSRTPSRPGDVAFDSAAPFLARATHLLATAPPGEEHDPVLARYGHALAHLQWCGYLSSTGVYGNRNGAWVDEATLPAPTSPRAARRLAAETAWRDARPGRPLDIIRLAGIYGPGRSVLDDLRAGRARRVDAPGHAFGRIHLDDIAHLVLAAAAQPGPAHRVLHGNDDLPAPSADVIAEAARLLDLAVPPLTPREEALSAMSPMARTFWADNRKVSSRLTRATLNLSWRHPTYREGLRATLQQELERPPEQRQVARP